MFVEFGKSNYPGTTLEEDPRGEGTGLAKKLFNWGNIRGTCTVEEWKEKDEESWHQSIGSVLDSSFMGN